MAAKSKARSRAAKPRTRRSLVGQKIYPAAVEPSPRAKRIIEAMERSEKKKVPKGRTLKEVVGGVAPSSVRFDQKMPREVHERLEEIANICALVAQFFEGDVAKTALWFRTRNPMLGDISPRDMIRFGRYAKLRQFVMEAVAESATSAARVSAEARIVGLDATTEALE